MIADAQAQICRPGCDGLRRRHHTARKAGIYGKVDIKLLTDKEATRDDIVEALEWLEGEVTSRDVGMVFMAGHGVTDNQASASSSFPSDADMDKLRSTAVSRDDMLNTMSNLAGKALDVHRCLPFRGKPRRRALTRGAPADITPSSTNSRASKTASSCSPPRPAGRSRSRAMPGRTAHSPRP